MLSVGYGGGTANGMEGLTGLSISNLSASLSYTLYPASGASENKSKYYRSIR